MNVICPVCSKEWDYHSETQQSSCGRTMCFRLIDKLQEALLEIDELEDK